MPRTKTAAEHAPRQQPNLGELMKRLEELERRVALLEAKQIKPKNTPQLEPAVKPPRSTGYEDAVSEADPVRDVEKP